MSLEKAMTHRTAYKTAYVELNSNEQCSLVHYFQNLYHTRL